MCYKIFNIFTLCLSVFDRKAFNVNNSFSNRYYFLILFLNYLLVVTYRVPYVFTLQISCEEKDHVVLYFI